MPFVHPATRPQLLLCSGTALIQPMEPPTLNVGSFFTGNHVSMVIRPRQIFRSGSLSTFQHIAGVLNDRRCGLRSLFHR